MKTRIKITGRFRLTAVPACVREALPDIDMFVEEGWPDFERLVEHNNLVVDFGVETIAGLIAAGYGSPTIDGNVMSAGTMRNFTVSKMLITDQASPTAPAAGDVSLEGTEVWTGDVEAAFDSLLVVTYPSSGKVNFGTLIPSTELNGTTITEAGLFSDLDLLIARVIFEKEKLGTFGLQCDHELTFTAV